MTKWHPEEKSIQKNKNEIEKFLLGKQIDCYRKKGPFCRLEELPQELVFIDDFSKIGAFLDRSGDVSLFYSKIKNKFPRHTAFQSELREVISSSCI